MLNGSPPLSLPTISSISDWQTVYSPRVTRESNFAAAGLTDARIFRTTASAMQIYIKRHCQRYGPYSLAEVNRQIAAGLLNPSEQGWHEAAPGWKPLFSIAGVILRSEEHTSELQSHSDLVCRLLLEKKKTRRCHI